MRPTILALMLVAGLLPSGNAARQEEAGFAPLFNGRDLSGWTNVNCAPETWSARDGMIVSTGKPICELRTTRMYENFVLELEYRHLDAGGNAGVFIWGDALTARGQPFVRAIEVQVLDGRNTDNYTSHGDVFPIHGARMTPDRPHPGGWDRSLPSERRARPAGEWNHYRITARDGTIKLAVNGKEVSGGHQITPRKGYIHLESEGGRVEWRNLRLKELPASPSLPPEHVAREDRQFLSLYTGTDFRGWQHTAAHAPHWASKDWIIAYDGKAEGPVQRLATERTFADAEIIVDWRWTTDGGAAGPIPVGLGSYRVPNEGAAAVERKLAAAPKGKPVWHRAVFTKRGGRLSLTLDDELMFENAAVEGAGAPAPITLQPEGRAVEFANIFVKAS